MQESVKERAGRYFNDAAWDKFKARLAYVTLDAEDPETFKEMAKTLEHAGETIFYLSTSPSLYDAISTHLREAGLVKTGNRVIVEKPIGRDLASSKVINDSLGRSFSEREIFRIDHYLGKETVQNLLALRFANALFEPLWNKVSIDHVQISVGETVGVEGRWSYYNDYGALRDMVQNHVLQLLCLVAMEPPASLDPDSGAQRKGQGASLVAADRWARGRTAHRARPVSGRRGQRRPRAGL